MSLKPDEGRGRCPYDPYQRNTALVVGEEMMPQHDWIITTLFWCLPVIPVLSQSSLSQSSLSQSSLSQLSTTGTGTGQGWLGPVLSLAGGKCRIAQLQDLLGNSQHEALMMNSNTSSFEVKLGSNGSCRAYYLQAAAVQCLLWPPLSFIRAWTRFNTVWTLLRFLLFL